MEVSPLWIAMLSVHSCPVGKLGTKDTGGMSVYIRELAREMGRRGHLVDIYTRSHGSACDKVVDLGTNVRLVHLGAGDGEAVNKAGLFPSLDVDLGLASALITECYDARFIEWEGYVEALH